MRHPSTPTPAAWVATDLDRFQRRYDLGADDGARRWYDVATALAPDGVMPEAHARFLAEGASAQAAAKWVVSEHVGTLAATLGYAYLRAGAAVLDVDRVRFGTHPDGWVQLVDLGRPRLAVLAGHPWAGLDGVEVVADQVELAEAVVSGVRRFGEPFVAAGRRLARVGAVSLWAEIVDGLALSVACEADRPADPADLAALDLVLDSPAAPWRKRPDLWMGRHRGTEVILGRKGGCCLAYQSEEPEPAEPPGPAERVEPDPWSVAWEAAFPPVEGEPAYCSTCCFRERDDCAARILWEREWEHQERERAAAEPRPTGGSVESAASVVPGA